MIYRDVINCGDRVRIKSHDEKKYIGKTGKIVHIESLRPPIPKANTDVMVCKVKLDDTGAVASCIDSVLEKL